MMNLNNLKSIFTILFPNIIGLTMGALCPMGGGNRIRTKSQPPGWVFGIVWPILYGMLGYSLLRNNKGNKGIQLSMHLALIFLLNYWVYIAGCKLDYKTGGWIFVPIIGLTIAIIVTGRTNFDKLLLVPLLSWLLFAHQLNVHLVEKN